jgi:hypothetical protein
LNPPDPFNAASEEVVSGRRSRRRYIFHDETQIASDNAATPIVAVINVICPRLEERGSGIEKISRNGAVTGYTYLIGGV